MFANKDAAPLRRTVGGLCLVLTPLLFAPAELLFPEATGNTASAQLGAYASRYDSVLAAVGLTLLMSMALLAGTFTLLSQVRARGAALANIAAAMLVYGVVTAHAALPGVNLLMAEMARPGNDRQAMLALMDRLFHNPMAVPLLLGHYVFALGIVLLGLALYRADVGPRWAAVCLALAPVADIVLGGLHVELVDAVVSDGLLLAGFTAVGVHLIRLRREPRLHTGTVPAGAASVS